MFFSRNNPEIEEFNDLTPRLRYQLREVKYQKKKDREMKRLRVERENSFNNF